MHFKHPKGLGVLAGAQSHLLSSHVQLLGCLDPDITRCIIAHFCLMELTSECHRQIVSRVRLPNTYVYVYLSCHAFLMPPYTHVHPLLHVTDEVR